MESDKRSLQELRSLQDWYLKYQLASIEGVAEVASIGGFVKQYQVSVDPARLSAYGIPLARVEDAIRRGNADAGGELIEMGEAEFMIRGLGYLRGIEDIRELPVSDGSNGAAPVRIRDVADVQVGPEMRRGLAELDGKGEVAGGVVVMRYGQNALEVIEAVKKKLEALKADCPKT